MDNSAANTRYRFTRREWTPIVHSSRFPARKLLTFGKRRLIGAVLRAGLIAGCLIVSTGLLRTASAQDGSFEVRSASSRLYDGVYFATARIDYRLSDDALAQIIELYGPQQAAELILCCSYFNMLSRMLESTRVQLEETAV